MPVATPLSKIPVLLRGGYIIPRKERIRRTSSLMEGDPFTLLIALDENAQAKGFLYVDDGKSYRHEKGDYHYVDFSFAGSVLTSSALNVKSWGTKRESAASEYGGRVERLILIGYPGSLTKIEAKSDLGEWDLSFTVKAAGHVVVKDPKVLIGTPFSINFS